ncbi:MAG: tetratricopeptide repeat protein [Polyangiaceae bacterium]
MPARLAFAFAAPASRVARVVAVTILASSLAYADPPKLTPEQTLAAQQAHQHAARAHELYQQGSYHEAITELETALKLDPNGKDLVFNLGVVHEKLGDIEDALRYFQRYEGMDLDAQERAKADTYLKRLQGARKEVEKPPEPIPVPVVVPPVQLPPEHYGRFDWLTASAAVIGVAGLAMGTAYGVKALADRPSGTTTTDTDGYNQYENSEATAHREAVTADVCFIAGAAGVAGAVVLFFARTRPSASPKAGSAGSAPPPVVLSGTPLRGGGALLLEARF